MNRSARDRASLRTLGLAATLLLACAAPATYHVTTDHFRAEIDRSWRPSVEVQPHLKTYVFRRQPDIEVRVYSWLDRRPDGEATSLVYEQLVRDPDTRPFAQAVGLPMCSPPVRRFRLLRQDAVVREHVARDGWYTVMAGARADGTLLAAVARRPNVLDCAQAEALARALQTFVRGLSPADLADPRPPAHTFAPLRGPEVILTPPTPPRY
jgi:hypothetical protein